MKGSSDVTHPNDQNYHLFYRLCIGQSLMLNARQK